MDAGWGIVKSRISRVSWRKTSLEWGDGKRVGEFDVVDGVKRRDEVRGEPELLTCCDVG